MSSVWAYMLVKLQSNGENWSQNKKRALRKPIFIVFSKISIKSGSKRKGSYAPSSSSTASSISSPKIPGPEVIREIISANVRGLLLIVGRTLNYWVVRTKSKWAITAFEVLKVFSNFMLKLLDWNWEVLDPKWELLSDLAKFLVKLRAAFMVSTY